MNDSGRYEHGRKGRGAEPTDPPNQNSLSALLGNRRAIECCWQTSRGFWRKNALSLQVFFTPRGPYKDTDAADKACQFISACNQKFLT